MKRGSRVYALPVTGSLTLQISTIVGTAVKGSIWADVGSGISSMSDSSIDWNPRIEEPSNPRPFSKMSSLSSDTGIEKCCHRPGRHPGGQRIAGEHGDDLRPQLAGIAEEEAVGAVGVHRFRRPQPGRDGAPGPADTVHADHVERVVVAELRLEVARAVAEET